MKKYKLLIIMFLVLVSSLIFFTNANAIASNQKYVVSNIDEFNNILSSAHEDTTIEIDGTVTITDSPSWPKSNVTITITGDVLDISKRVVNILAGIKESGIDSEEPVIVVADDLTPSETVQMDKSKILAFVTRFGSQNSHTAILARSMNLPSLINTDIELLDELSVENVDALEIGKELVVKNSITTH